ncbi:hypothetical protein D3C76_1731070 [compost metagenome]
MPGAFVAVGEVTELHVVEQEGIAARYIGVPRIPAHALVGQAKGVGRVSVGQHGAIGAVVDVAAAGVLGPGSAYFGLQRLLRPQGLEMDQAEDVLAVDIL